MGSRKRKSIELDKFSTPSTNNERRYSTRQKFRNVTNHLNVKEVKESDSSTSPIKNDLDKEKYCKTIQEILGFHYANVLERLNLTHTPRCIIEFVECEKFHSKNNENFHVDNTIATEARIYSSYEQYEEYCFFLDNIINNDQFIGIGVLTDIFENILCCNCDESEGLTNEYVLSELGIILDKIFYKFPPCYPSLRSDYLKLFTGTFKTEKNYKFNQNLFTDSINILNDLMDNDDHIGNLDKRKREKNITEARSYQEWEKLTNEKQKTLERNEKIERLIFSLNYLLKILEIDLGLWILKKFRKLSNDFKEYKTNPLIFCVIWPISDNIGEINNFIKQIIKVFIKSIILNYPDDVIRILSRLINLISHTMSLTELCVNENLIEYPRKRFTRTEMFTNELLKILTNYQNHYRYDLDNKPIQLYQTILLYVKPSFVRIILCRLIINKINKWNLNEIKMKTIYECLNKIDWKYDFKQGKPELKNKQKKTIVGEGKYPIFDEKLKLYSKKSYNIYLMDYINIVFIMLKAYLDYTRLSKFIRRIQFPDMNKKIEVHTEKLPFFFTTDIEEIYENFLHYTNESKQQYKSSDELKPKIVTSSVFFKNILIDENLILSYLDDVKWFFEFTELIKSKSLEFNKETKKMRSYLEKA